MDNNLRESIRHKLKAPNLAFAVMNRLQKPYHGMIGEKLRVTGFLVSRNNRYFIEMPPKEFLGYYPEITHPLSLLVNFETQPPPVGTLSSFKGIVKARHDRISKIQKSSQVFGERYLEIDEWEHDYTDVYAECPLELKDIIKMVREQLNPEPPLDLALLYSPISSPPVFNTMGGVSSILSGIDFDRSELTQIGQFLHNLVPPWHHRDTVKGFHIALYPELTPKVSMMLQNRRNSDLEFSPLVTRVRQIDLDKERGFFHFDDPLVLTSNLVAYDETYREIDEFRPEIQWSLREGAYLSQERYLRQNVLGFGGINLIRISSGHSSKILR